MRAPSSTAYGLLRPLEAKLPLIRRWIPAGLSIRTLDTSPSARAAIRTAPPKWGISFSLSFDIQVGQSIESSPNTMACSKHDDLHAICSVHPACNPLTIRQKPTALPWSFRRCCLYTHLDDLLFFLLMSRYTLSTLLQ